MPGDSSMLGQFGGGVISELNFTGPLTKLEDGTL